MIPVVERTVREIPIALVDDPEIAMRETFNDAAYAELRESIRVNGVQVPLIVEERGDRFRVSAGHRRLTVCRELGAATVPCDVRAPGVLDAEAIKILENDDREKVNAAEAALYLARLFVERCHNDVDELCALVRRTRTYVENRLLLIQGDEEIFAALRARTIGLGVALELNQIRDVGYRRMHLDQAVRGGMTENAARQARREANRALEMGPRAADNGASLDGMSAGPVEAKNVCTVCLKTDHPERMRWIPIHEHCDLAILQPLIAPFRTQHSEVGGG